jgi:hypothetical protein
MKVTMARLAFAAALLGIFALTISPLHTHRLPDLHHTPVFDHAQAPAFCFECAFGSHHAAFAPDTRIAISVVSTVRAAESLATVRSMSLPTVRGRAPPAA